MKYSVLVLLVAGAALAETLAMPVEIAIQQAEAAWANAIAAKSLEGTLAMYDVEAFATGSAMPPARGIKEIRAMWVKAFSRPGFSFSWKPGNVVIAESVLSTSTGSWRMTAPDGSGPYLAVWRKQRDGTWKIVVDSA